MALSKQTEEERASWWLFLKANPIGVDPNIINPDVMSDLPENVRQTLWAETTSSLIYLLGDENGLSEDQISDIARTIREIALGNITSGNLTQELKNKLGTTDAIAQNIASKLTKELIAPNYFQISQLYEKKHRVGAVPTKTSAPRQPLAGRPLESLEQKRATIEATAVPGKPTTSMGDWAGDLEPEDQSTQIVANKPSRNVVDLRKSPEPLPSKLPPTPPVVSRPE
ncbi:MAG: hypothetical protein Q7S57_01130 [bacterium]|nr:hypothetical protein [bacterium]